jgi:hypothetical protein
LHQSGRYETSEWHEIHLRQEWQEPFVAEEPFNIENVATTQHFHHNNYSKCSNKLCESCREFSGYLLCGMAEVA